MTMSSQTLIYKPVTRDALDVGVFTLELLLQLVLLTLNFLLGPSSTPISCQWQSRGEYGSGNRKGRGIYCQLILLHPCPTSQPVSLAASLLTSSRPILFLTFCAPLQLL